MPYKLLYKKWLHFLLHLATFATPHITFTQAKDNIKFLSKGTSCPLVCKVKLWFLSQISTFSGSIYDGNLALKRSFLVPFAPKFDTVSCVLCARGKQK